MILEEHIKEDLSRAYVLAVGAKAGAIVSIKDRSHDYGIDGTFYEVDITGKQRFETGTVLDFQLKATTRAIFQDDFVSYSLESRAFNLLSHRSRRPYSAPAILILLALPSESEKWLEISEKELVLRSCCYWAIISSIKTTNIFSVTVKIPRSQVLTSEALKTLLRKTSTRELV